MRRVSAHVPPEAGRWPKRLSGVKGGGARLGHRGQDTLDDLRPHLLTSIAVHDGHLDGRHIQPRRDIGQQAAADRRHHVALALDEMHLETDPRCGRQLSDFGHQGSIRMLLGQPAALLLARTALRCVCGDVGYGYLL